MNFDDLLKQFRMWQDIINSPFRKIIQDFEDQRSHLQSVFDTAQIEKYYLNNNNLTYIQNLNEEYSKWRSIVDTSAISNFQNQLSSIIDNIKLPALCSIANEWRKVIDDASAIQKFSQSFGGQIIESLHQITSAGDRTHASQQVDYLDKLLIDKLSKLPKIQLSKEAIVQIILAIVLFIVTIFHSMQSEDNISSKIDEVEEVVLDKLHETEDHLLKKFEELETTENKNFYVATKHVNLRLEPSTNSEVIYILSPNMLVEVMEKKGNWFSVQFFDYIEGRLKKGWAYGEHLTPASEDNENESSVK